MNFLTALQAHLNLVQPIIDAVKAFQAIGHSKETTLQKIGQMIEVSAAVGELVPIPIVASVSALVESIAQQAFASTTAPATTTPATTPTT